MENAISVLIVLFILGAIAAILIDARLHNPKKEKVNPYSSRLDPVTKKPILVCPKCGCQDIGTTSRGFTLTTGFLFSGKQYHVCNNCLHKFR